MVSEVVAFDGFISAFIWLSRAAVAAAWGAARHAIHLPKSRYFRSMGSPLCCEKASKVSTLQPFMACCCRPPRLRLRASSAGSNWRRNFFTDSTNLVLVWIRLSFIKMYCLNGVTPSHVLRMLLALVVGATKTVNGPIFAVTLPSKIVIAVVHHASHAGV